MGDLFKHSPGHHQWLGVNVYFMFLAVSIRLMINLRPDSRVDKEMMQEEDRNPRRPTPRHCDTEPGPTTKAEPETMN